MNLLEQKQREIDALKSKLKIQEEKLSLQEQKIASLEKQNQWYIEHLSYANIRNLVLHQRKLIKTRFLLLTFFLMFLMKLKF